MAGFRPVYRLKGAGEALQFMTVQNKLDGLMMKRLSIW